MRKAAARQGVEPGRHSPDSIDPHSHLAAMLAGIIRRGRLETESVFGVVQCGLLAVAFSLLPITLSDAGSEATSALQILAAIFLLLWSVMWVRAAFVVWDVRRDPAAGTLIYEGVIIFAVSASGSVRPPCRARR